MTDSQKILLGSGSPRRRQLIEALGFEFRVLKSDTAEIPKEGLKRADIALFLAEEKCDALYSQKQEDEILVTADTIVCFGDIVLNKPGDEAHALEMLSKLNGATHQVYTGVCIVNGGQKKLFAVESDVTFNLLSTDLLLQYIRTYKPFDKAGSYGAQECLPEGMNPCSPKEITFLNKQKLTNLFNETLTSDSHNVIPLIDHIDGSYFNVMGLPIVELWESINQ
jgi:septum formation protein